jgi:hypothetical protein
VLIRTTTLQASSHWALDESSRTDARRVVDERLVSRMWNL